MAYDVKQHARRVFDELWNQGKIDAIDQIVDASYQGYQPIVGGLNRDGLKQAVGLFRKAFPDLRFEIKDLIAEGDKVLVRWNAAGTFKNPFMGIAPNGNLSSVDGLTYIEIRNGKSIRDFTHYDVLTLYRNMGVELPKQMGIPGKAAQPEQPARH
ncbi:MAG: ester cyclase [Deltaproteobacteria bacterium]|nr:ester cyclase [Deltaproteobacteria bacterium]